MSRSKRTVVFAVVVFAAVVALAPVHTIRWSGGFPGGEYRLTFADQNGRPVPAVTLRVETKAGSVCHLYPISEFLPGQPLTSDAEGRMTFHHVGTSEFGGRITTNLLGITYHRSETPQYTCVFSLGGREVHRVRYDDLRQRGIDHPMIDREWDVSAGPMGVLIAAQGDMEVCLGRLFGGTHHTDLDYERRVALTYFHGVLERNGNRPVRFEVVERTITIP